MSQPIWTKAQKRAIETTGCDVLVAASAGTGKTAVLSQRCVERICDLKNPADVEQLLVLTFTEAAAEEMKTRIESRLRSVCRQHPDKGRLRRQLTRLEAAHIGTIHSFCKRILTEHFYLAGLDPRFGILDPDQRALIRTEVLTATIENAWSDLAMAEAMQTLFKGRKFDGGASDFAEIIPRLSDFLDSIPDREAFYRTAANVPADTLAKLESAYLMEQLILAQKMLNYARKLDHQIASGQYLTVYIDGILATLDNCLGFLSHNKLPACAERIRQWEFDRLPALKKGLDVDKTDAEKIKTSVENARSKIKSLKDLCFLYPNYLDRIAEQNTAQTQTLVELLKRFDQAYMEAKRRLNVLDFADLEHRLLAMLQAHPDAALRLRERFAYVFIDEYQDVNEVQYAILKHVCRSDNLFVVGDVKQSIYAFRQSRPDIFLQRLSAAADQPDIAGSPVRIDMNDNFRSRAEILSFVNHIFARTMTSQTAGMDYDRRAELIAGLKTYPQLKGDTPLHRKAVEWYLLDQEESDQLAEDDANEDSDNSFFDVISPSQRQAAFIARRIRLMVGADSGTPEFEVMDKHTGKMRPVEYRDIVVLMRALSSRAAEYVEMLRLAGVPVSSQSQCGYFAATEVTDFLSLLKTLDNPLQDIDLAAVLRSPMFHFTDSHLAAIRLAADKTSNSKGSFYDAVVHYTRHGDNPEYRGKTADALTRLKGWRDDAQHKPLSDLIRRILDTTGFAGFVSALPNGPQRRANLLKLYDRAIQFESFVGAAEAVNLSAFVEFVEKLREQETDWAPAQPDNFAENTVTVMTVHKSKGLEYPVVILAELNRKFKSTDSNGVCQIEPKMLGLELLDPDTGQKCPTPIHQLIRLNKLHPAIAEEMRILYVAMTRARDRLVLVGSQKSEKCLSMLGHRGEKIPDFELLCAKSHLDWLLLAMSDSQVLARVFASDYDGRLAEEDLFVVSRISKSDLDALANDIQQRKRRRGQTASPLLKKDISLQVRQGFADLCRDLTWQYPYAPMTALPAKFSVSALSHRDDEFAKVPLEDSFKPVSRQPGTGALELGSAVHLVFQHLPLSASIDAQAVNITMTRLVNENRLTANITKQINPNDIVQFFTSEPGMLAIQYTSNVYREWPFTMALDVSELSLTCPGEFVVVQGIIDMIIPTEKGLVIVDFKTDKINRNAVAERASRYTTQLALYAQAAAKILNTPVIQTWLYFLNANIAYAVNPAASNMKSKALSDITV